LAEGRELLAAELARLRQALAAGRAGEIRQAAGVLVDAAILLAGDLWCIAAMRPAGAGAASSLRAGVIGLVAAALDVGANEGSENDLPRRQETVRVAAARLLAIADGCSDDPCADAFGVPQTDLLDARGVVSPTRLLGTYYRRYGELEQRLHTLLSVVTNHPPDLLNALRPAQALVLTPRPLLAIRTAVRVRALLDEALEADAARLARPLRNLKLRVDRSAANHAGILRTARDLVRTDSDSEEAALTLDLYRKMAEGQLRPWAWTLLQIRGRLPGRPPELSALRDQLLADGHPLLRDAAVAILPVARNAAAHEDYLWDDEGQVLAVGETSVTLGELRDAIERAYLFMGSAECAWACTRAASPKLAALLDLGDAAGRLHAMDERRALSHFGTNGLLVRDWSHERGIFRVALDDLPFSRINPCFQGVMWASRHLGRTGRFQVTLPDHEQVAMDLSRWALDATFVVWQQARASFEAMPLSTFLPANAWVRLAVELPDQAALAAAWLGLNDAVQAYDEAHEDSGSWKFRIAELALRLDLVEAALAATLAVLPPAAGAPLEKALDLVVPAADWASSASKGGTPGPSAALEERIRTVHDLGPVPSVLSTVDPRSLDFVERSQDGI
jgi:hypothetical protein